MPFAFLAALAGSFAIHAAALFLPDVDLSTAPEPPPITAELKPPPAASEIPARAKPQRALRRDKPAKVVAATASEVAAAAAIAVPQALPPQEPEMSEAPVPEPEVVPEPEPLPAVTAEPRLPGRGHIHFAVYKGTQGLLVGRSEHSWEFADGRYRLAAVTETIGLAALFKPIRIELESRGKLLAQGLQPERFSTRRNGAETNENADFDWEARQLTLARDGSRRELRDGAQDLLSFHYQLGYLDGLEQGTSMGVATGKKFERYQFDAVGQEDIETPAGRFRTLHVRVQTDSTTELWLAVDRQLLPVKIRHTDRKGESFEQVATELGM